MGRRNQLYSSTKGNLIKTQKTTYDDLDKFIGLDCKTISELIDVKINTTSKGYYQQISKSMFQYVGLSHINYKTTCVRPDGQPKESMSFPYFQYCTIANQEWNESQLHSIVESGLKLSIFSKNEKDPRESAIFLGVVDWTFPEEDKKIIEQTWIKTKTCILKSDYDNLPKISDDRIIHVRPHARNADDTCMCPDNVPRTKRSFFINSKYIGQIVKEKLM